MTDSTSILQLLHELNTHGYGGSQHELNTHGYGGSQQAPAIPELAELAAMCNNGIPQPEPLTRQRAICDDVNIQSMSHSKSEVEILLLHGKLDAIQKQLDQQTQLMKTIISTVTANNHCVRDMHKRKKTKFKL